MESEEYHEEMAVPSTNLGTAAKLVIMVGSLAMASIVGVYVHPHLLPLVTDWTPLLWSAAQAWMTPPILFLLLNVVVGTLYVTSNALSIRAAPPESGRLAPTEALSEGAPPIRPAGAAGLRARIQNSRTLTRLVRSKSEQMPSITSKVEAAGRLKKAGTFETTPRSRRPVVVVADPPEDAPAAGHEEVDKKAEDFISRFYHKVKLQRLDSLLRQQQQAQTGPTD